MKPPHRSRPRDPAFVSEVALGPGCRPAEPGHSGRAGTLPRRAHPDEALEPALAFLAGWRRIAGPQIAHRCRVLGLSAAGTLVIGVPDARWEHEIGRHAARLASDLARAGLPVRALRCERLAESPVDRGADLHARADGNAPGAARAMPAAGDPGAGADFATRFDGLAERFLRRGAAPDRRPR